MTTSATDRRVLGKSDHRTVVRTTAPAVCIDLPEASSAGYTWSDVNTLDNCRIASELLPADQTDDPEQFGAQMIRRFTIEWLQGPVRQDFRFDLKRSWNKNGQLADSFLITIEYLGDGQ